MKKNVLGGLLGSKHTKIHLSGLKAQYKAKMELLPDRVSFQSFSFSSCWTTSIYSQNLG